MKDLGRDLPPMDGAFIAVGPAGQPGAYLQLRVRGSEGVTLHNLIQAEKIAGPPVVYASASIPDVAMLLGSIAGGLGGIAAVMTAFLHRHDGRKVTLIYGDKSVEVTGLGPAEQAAEIDRALRFAADRQNAANEVYAEANIQALPWPPARASEPEPRQSRRAGSPTDPSA